jgi:hypothetical protein
MKSVDFDVDGCYAIAIQYAPVDTRADVSQGSFVVKNCWPAGRAKSFEFECRTSKKGFRKK